MIGPDGVPRHPIRFVIGFSGNLYEFCVVWWVQVI